ncbi:MAG: HAD family hydrolase [Sphaerochaeta sp.]|jgi:phosphoglycolate phosphatase
MAQTADKLKAIIFDKDGTLFEYAEVWESVLIASIENAFTVMGKHDRLRAKEALLRLMGIDEEGNCLPSGLVFTHRRVQIFRRFLTYCIRWRVNAIKALRAYHLSLAHSERLLSAKLATMDFSMQQHLFSSLKDAGYHIGIITNDSDSSTALFLSLMGLQQYIDFVASRESHYKRKPHPQAFFEFCTRFSLTPCQVAMVGDTLTDMLFARKAGAGYRIGVLSGSNDARRLERHSDIVYPNISVLLDDNRLFSSN